MLEVDPLDLDPPGGTALKLRDGPLGLPRRVALVAGGDEQQDVPV
ncbi:hypothetical protein ACLQ28_17965 [Micromonospora sp. DT201]